MMKHKEADQALGYYLTDFFDKNDFIGRGCGTARRWERKAGSGIARHVIVTPCAPVRAAASVVTCGVAIRFDEIETELASLTSGSICFRPSRDTATIGASLARIVQPSGGLLLQWKLIDEIAINKAGLEIESLLASHALPWLDRMQNYESAYQYLIEELTAWPKDGCVNAFRAFLVGQQIGFNPHQVILHSLEQTIQTDDVGADVCRSILKKLK